jgi:hypothetical protein
MHKPESEDGTEAALMAVVAPDLRQVCDAYSRTERADYSARIELLFAAVMTLAHRSGASGSDEGSADALTLGIVEELEQRFEELAEREALVQQRSAALQQQNKDLVADLAAMQDQLEGLRRAAEKAAQDLELHRRKFGQIEIDHDLLLHSVGKKNA